MSATTSTASTAPAPLRFLVEAPVSVYCTACLRTRWGRPSPAVGTGATPPNSVSSCNRPASLFAAHSTRCAGGAVTGATGGKSGHNALARVLDRFWRSRELLAALR